MADLGSVFKGRWTIWIIALAFALLTAFGVLSILGRWADQRAYYVLSQDVPANYEITPDLVVELTTNVDGVPPTALNQAQIAEGNLFSRIPMKAGDVLTSSVVGPPNNPVAALPPGYVLATLKVAPERAVGGRVSAGDYIDIAAVQPVGDTPVAKVVLHHVLVLDVAVSPETIAEAANEDGTFLGPDSQANYNGFPEIYTVAVTPTDFLTLALIAESQVFIALTSPTSSGPLDAIVNGDDIFKPGEVPATGPILSTNSNVVLPTEEQVSAAYNTEATLFEVKNTPESGDATGLVSAEYQLGNGEGAGPQFITAGALTTVADIEAFLESNRTTLSPDVLVEKEGVLYIRQGPEGSPIWMAYLPAEGYIAMGICSYSENGGTPEEIQQCAATAANLVIEATNATPAPTPAPSGSPSPGSTGTVPAVPSASAVPSTSPSPNN